MDEKTRAESSERLNLLLDGRQPYPWGQSLGISRGTIGRMVQGKWPDPRILLQMIREEGVSLSWLLANIGPPFPRRALSIPQEGIDWLNTISRETSVLVLRSPNGACLIDYSVRTEVSDQDESATYQWWDCSVLSGLALNESIQARATALCNKHEVSCHLAEVNPPQLAALLAGQLSNKDLFGLSTDPDGKRKSILNTAREVVAAQAFEALRSTPAGARYWIGESRPDTREVVDLYQRCSHSQQLALYELMRGLARS